MSKQLNLNCTPVFHKNYKAIQENPRIIVNQGGTRSSKTYSLMQIALLMLLGVITRGNVTGLVIDVIRKTLPACRNSVMRDFFEILINHGYYDKRNHNKTDNTYMFNGNLISFIGLDDPQKIRGRKRHFAFLNEANELRHEDYKQIIFRTEWTVFIDFNPSDEFHWIYDKVLTRDDCQFIKSTYLDNPFLNNEIVAEIERLKDEDPTYWAVYGLGERGASKSTIFPKWDIVNDIDLNRLDDWCFGMDFGYIVPSALVLTGFRENDLYWEECLYQSGLDNASLIEKLNEINKNHPEYKLKRKIIYCDNAEPKAIAELCRAGFKAKKANKKNFLHAVRTIKSYNLHITKKSFNLQKEIKFYKFKEDKDGNVLEEQVKFNDHGIDAGRYGTYTYIHDRTIPSKDVNYEWA